MPPSRFVRLFTRRAVSKPISSYPERMRQAVVDRRMRQYDPKGGNGLGVLAAKAQYERRLGRAFVPEPKPEPEEGEQEQYDDTDA